MIAIIGGGIGGLTFALACEALGLDYHVYERADGPSEVGAGITLWANALNCLRFVGAEQSVRAKGVRAAGGVIALSTGRVLMDLSLADVPKEHQAVVDLLAIHRGRLQAALLSHIPDGKVSFSRGCTAIENLDAPTVSFADGSKAHVDIVVGADGLRSRVRDAVCGEGPLRYSGTTCWRAICPSPVHGGARPGEYWGGATRFGWIPISDDEAYYFAVADAAAGTVVAPSDRKAHLMQLFSEYGFGIPAMIASTPDAAILQHDLSDRLPVSGWSKGHVVLLGDAAHPTTPNMGQGAAMAMESAVILARLLAQKDKASDAFARYHEVRRDRTATTTRTSWAIGQMAHSKNALIKLARNAMFAWLPLSVRLRQLSKVASYDAGRIAL